jgi:hypothetical protein
MDSSTVTTVVTLIVALVTGLLAYSTALSAKEKEIKLSVLQKLGIDSHAAIETLQNNTEWMIQNLIFTKNITRRKLLEADKQSPADIDMLRQLRVRIMFFDKDAFQKYDLMLDAHGNFSPVMLGLGDVNGTIPSNPNAQLTHYERKINIYHLRRTLSLIEETKEQLTNKTATKYNSVLSSSRVINLCIFISIAVALLILFLFPHSKEEKTISPSNTIYIIN